MTDLQTVQAVLPPLVPDLTKRISDNLKEINKLRQTINAAGQQYIERVLDTGTMLNKAKAVIHTANGQDGLNNSALTCPTEPHSAG